MRSYGELKNSSTKFVLLLLFSAKGFGNGSYSDSSDNNFL